MTSDVSDFDAKFQCDAPSYIDFNKIKSGIDEDEGIDEWFDTHRDEEGGIFIMDENEEEMMHLSKEDVEVLAEEGDLPAVSNEIDLLKAGDIFDDDFGSVAEGPAKDEVGEAVDEESPGEMDTAEDNAEMDTTEGNNQQVNKSPAAEMKASAKNDIFAIWREVTSKSSEASAVEAVRKSPKKSTRSSGDEATSGKPYCSTSVTLPETPDVYKRYQLKQARKAEHMKTSEDMELEAIAKKRKETIQVLKMSKASFNKIRSTKPLGSTIKPKKSAITKVKEFKFHSHASKPEGQSTNSKANQGDNPSSSHLKPRSSAASSLSGIKPPSARLVGGAAKPRKVNNNFISVAEVVANYQKRTPVRFHTLSQREQASGPVASRFTTSTTAAAHPPHSGTRPVSPALHTRCRTRGTDALSRSERERLEMEENRRQPFKARPLNPKIMDPSYHGMCGVVKEASRPTTKAVTPKLATARREACRKKGEKSNQPSASGFKALDIPRDMFACVKGVPEKRANAITIPQSPAFHLKKRKAEHDDTVSSTESEKLAFKPHVEHKHTEVKPFKFEERYQSKPTRQEYIKNKLEEEQRELAEKRAFHAQPVVHPPAPGPRPPAQATKAVPFNLQSDLRGSKYQEEFEKKKQTLQEEARIKAEFHATENSVIYSKPFVPCMELGRKPLREVEPFTLNTEARAESRRAYEQQRLRQEEEQERMLAAEKESLEREEHKRLMEYRKTLVHHAAPVKHFKATKIKKSDRLPTQPISPKLATSERCASENAV